MSGFTVQGVIDYYACRHARLDYPSKKHGPQVTADGQNPALPIIRNIPIIPIV